MRATYYDLATGEFSTRTVFSSRNVTQIADLNCPDGHGWKVGSFDPVTQRVDLATGEVVVVAPVDT
jgi:hypothetical protein